MADIDLKTETPDTSLPATGFLFGADSQASASPSVYSTQAVATTLLGSTTLSGTTITANAPVFDFAQTWNNAAVTFTGAKLNITDTASNAASLLMDLQTNTGGAPTSRFSITKNGSVNIPVGSYGNSAIRFGGFANTGMHWSGGLQLVDGGGSFAAITTVGLNFYGDVIFGRRGAANLRLGAADAAGSSIAISSVDTTAETLTLASAHGLTSGAAVQFITTGSLPGGIVVNTTYYARVIDTTTIEIYETFGNATAASGTTGRVNLTSAGSSSSCQRAAPFQQLSVQGFTGTDIPGQPLIINGSQGTGTGRGGPIIFRVAPAGTTGSTANAFLDALTINPDRSATFGSRIITTATDYYAGTFLTNMGGLYWIAPGGGSSSFSGIGSTFRGFILFGEGIPRVTWGAGNPTTFSTGIGFWNTSDTSYRTSDVILERDAANTLALRNGTAAQESRVYGSFVSATNFQRLSVKTLREVSTALSGATYVSTIAIPAYAVLIGVTTRVNTAITGATTYDVGDGTDVDLWGAAIPIAINSESRTANFTAVAATGAAATSRTVTLTANGSNFTGGVVEICLHYLTTEAD
jgi:hypothetical protein